MVTPHFKTGQLIHHKLFDYRGVIVKVDDFFQLTEDWYKTMASKSKPPKNKPWYSVLVHNQTHLTYVAERNLTLDNSNEDIIHPMVPIYFTTLKNGVYSKTTNWVDGEPVILSQVAMA